jgi:hypothetical protein
MSEVEVKREPFVIMPIWVYNLKAGATFNQVYLAIQTFTDGNGQGFPTWEAIASRADVTERTVGRAIKFFKDRGAITVENQYRNNQQVQNLYTLPMDNPQNTRPDTGVTPSIRPDSTVTPALTPQSYRTRTIEQEPYKEKEKILKEKETTPKTEAIEEFVSKVKASYPPRTGNMGWKYFTQRAASHFKTAKSKDDFLLAVSAYKKECAMLETSPRHVMMPATFIAKHYDYIPTHQEQPAERKVIKIAPWKEIGAR